MSPSQPEAELHLLRFLISEERRGFTAATLRLQEGTASRSETKETDLPTDTRTHTQRGEQGAGLTDSTFSSWGRVVATGRRGCTGSCPSEEAAG